MKMILMGAAAVVAGTAALAQTAAPPAPVQPMADGAMTRDEVVAKVRGHFARFDTDRDGSISKAEMESVHGRMGARKMAEGGQRRMMMREREMRDPNVAFDRLDANNDGMISRDEFAKGREIRIERRMVRREKIKDGKLGATRMQRMGQMAGARMIVMADSDKDGRITLAEAESMALRRFDQMDSNRDGKVTREERRAGRVMMMRKMPTPTGG